MLPHDLEEQNVVSLLEVEISDADRENERDPQLERAIAYLQEQDE